MPPANDKVVDTEKLKGMREGIENKYKQSMAAFERNTGHKHPLDPALRDANATVETEKGDDMSRNEQKDSDVATGKTA